MYQVMADLFIFFGIDQAVSNLADLLPWLFKVSLGIGIFVLVLRLVFGMAKSLSRGRMF